MNFSPSVRAKFIVLGEVNIVYNALRRAKRWSTHSYQNDHEDPLIRSFDDLKNILNRCDDLFELDALTFLSPFLEVIRAEETSGPTTSHALTSLNKFIVYDLIDLKASNVANAVSSIADAVTHARFVGTDPSHDEVVLTKILQVLRSLLLQSIGTLLTNEAVCEIMQSCFRICFETRLSDLLRKTAEHTLVDMIQVLFVRLPTLKDNYKMYTSSMKKLKMRAGGMPEAGGRGKRASKRNQTRQKRASDASSKKPPPSVNNNNATSNTAAATNQDEKATNDATSVDDSASVASAEVATTPVSETLPTLEENINSAEEPTTPVDKTVEEPPKMESSSPVVNKPTDELDSSVAAAAASVLEQDDGELADTEMGSEKETPLTAPIANDAKKSDELDTQSIASSTAAPTNALNNIDNTLTGVLAPAPKHGVDDPSGPLVPYGLPCVRELFRFLISLINPHDPNNLDHMNLMGMSLLTVALEVSRDEMAKFPSIISLIKDEMCRYLFQLLNVEKINLVASALRVSLLLFESLRKDLKFQLESFIRKLMELISNEQSKLSYELKELALETIMQMWHIPGFVTELYLNYDVDLYCSNIFDDLSRLLSKHAFPVSGLYPTHLLSLDTLLTVVRSIEQRCNKPDDYDDEVKPEQEEAVSSDASETEEDTNITVPPTTIDTSNVTNEEGADDTALAPEEDSTLPERFSSCLPSIEELREIKKKKKILQTCTELFNKKPKDGIAALQQAEILDNPLDADQVSQWLRSNPWLDKAMIGEYLSDRRFPNLKIHFVRTFKFEGLRLDEALRLYLETFRLPGEAPVIEKLVIAFSDYWLECNNHPFKDSGTAFVLTYAVIMLNTDQHNRNVRKQHKPMSMEQFLRNTKSAIKVDYDDNIQMLEDIYNTIKNDEIVLPEEQTGPVRDKWLWNVLIRRGATKEGRWLSAPSPSDGNKLSLYDADLFTMSWGPTVSALSYVFDKSMSEQIIQRSITGFKKCAMISAHFGMSEVFDNLIISLCKFTGLMSNNVESAEQNAILFGDDGKAQLAARTALKLAHRHGDILREGWRNILDIILPLFRAKLLPNEMTEAEDFVAGSVTLLCEEPTLQRPEGILSSIYYNFIGGGPGDNSAQKQNTPEDQQNLRYAQECVAELQLENLVTESKFLRLDSLHELVKALMTSSRASHMYDVIQHGGEGGVDADEVYSEDSAVFYLELLLRVVLQNRDRILSLWQMIRDHLYEIIVNASEYCRMLERAVVGLLRIAIRLLHREDVADEILASLQILIMIKPPIIARLSRQISYGLDVLLRENAANIHVRDDWNAIFTIMKCVGAGSIPPLPIPHMTSSSQQQQHDLSSNPVSPPPPSSDKQLPLSASTPVDSDLHDRKTQSDSETVGDGHSSQGLFSDRGYTSDSEVYVENTNNEDTDSQVIPPPPNPCNQFTLQLGEELHQHDMRAMVKCCETLAFLVRDTAHITPDNFELCVRCIRTFAEASINGVNRAHHTTHDQQLQQQKLAAQDKKKLRKRKERDVKRRIHNNNNAANHSHAARYTTHQHSDDDSSHETVPDRYNTLSLQLIDLMHQLHTKAGDIYRSWAAEEQQQEEANEDSNAAVEVQKVEAEASSLWDRCWCPLLQGIARLCCDARRQVRTMALTYLQRALLNHDLHTLTGKEWESCFNKVLFPLLTKLLENISPVDPDGMEETRMRGATLLSKVFLQHLTPLLSLPTFTALWLTILDFMDKYMHIGKRDLLFEAIPESLKNMLLVMHTAGIFHSSETPSGHTSLWDVTWERINDFLPNLKNELVLAPSPGFDHFTEPKKELTAPTAPEVIRGDIATAVPQQQQPATSHITQLAGDAPQAPLSPPAGVVATPAVPPVGLTTPVLPAGVVPATVIPASVTSTSAMPAGIIPAVTPKLTPPSSLVQTPASVVHQALNLQTSKLGSPPTNTNILMNQQPPSFMVHPVITSPTLPTVTKPLAHQQPQASVVLDMDSIP